MKRKSILPLLTAGLLALTLPAFAACGKKGNDSKTTTDAPSTSAPAHEHTFATDWSKDADNHWYAATCEHTTEVKGKAAHTWNSGKVTKAATEEAEGVKTFACTVCGQTKTEKIDKLPHTHKFADTWSKDADNHWHAATCAHTSEVKDKAAHTWNSGEVTKAATEEADGVKTFTCTVCGQTRTEAIPALTHSHTYANEWSKDATNHWHAATCAHTTEKKDSAAHTFGNWTETKAPTYTEKGEKQRTCSVCSYVDKQEIAVLEAKENSLTVKDGVTLGKRYDGRAIALTKDLFVYSGDGEVTFRYKAKGATVFTEEAPSAVGEYVVKVSVKGTSEWKSVEKEFDFTIAKVRLASMEKALEVMYDGATTQFDLTGKITEKVAGDDIKLVVRMNGFAVGSTVSEVEFSGKDKDNYIFDTAKLSVVIGKARINIGHTKYHTECKSGVWKTVFELTKDDGVVSKDGVLEDVSIEILHDNVWANKKSYALYTENATKASNIERVTLTGADAGNYCFECTDTGDLDATLDCTIRESVINGTLDPNNDYDWGGINDIDNITFADDTFIIRGGQGEMTDFLIDAENSFKQLKFEVYISGTSILIAKGTRTMWDDGIYGYDYSGCQFIVNEGGPADMEFYLIKNVAGYTDENGYWICEQKEVNVTLKVTETTTVVETGAKLFDGNQLNQNAFALVKYTHIKEDASSIRVELIEGATAEVEVKVFGKVGGKFKEVTISGMDYELEHDQTYYILVIVTAAGTGNVEIAAYN